MVMIPSLFTSSTASLLQCQMLPCRWVVIEPEIAKLISGVSSVVLVILDLTVHAKETDI